MSKTVRWGILGTARIASRIAPAIRRAEGAELAAIASRDKTRAAEWAAEHGAAGSFGSYEALLADPEIDAVYIPLPPALHHEWTLKAAEHGKHVLSEKPLAASVADAEDMVAACGEHGVQLMDGVMWLHHPRAADMRSLLETGQLGDFRRLTSAFTFCWDTIPTGDLRLDRQLGGGSLLDLGWYCVSGALWAFDQLPERVMGHASWFQDVDMTFSALLWYPDGLVASFDTGFNTTMRRWFEIAGTDGSLVCDDFTRPYDEHKVRCWTHDRNGNATEHQSPALNQETCMIEAFVRQVCSGELNSQWPEQSLRTQRICAALDESARTERIIELGEERSR